MTKQLSLFIYWVCSITMVLAPIVALYYLWNIVSFAALARTHIGLPIVWASVDSWQWYILWLCTFLYLMLGVYSLYILRRPFKNFAKGELFSLSNSLNLRSFSKLLFAQALAKPLLFTLSSVLLSLNHASGEKILSISLGSNEFTIIALAVIFWVISNLLVEANRLKTENQEFV